MQMDPETDVLLSSVFNVLLANHGVSSDDTYLEHLLSFLESHPIEEERRKIVVGFAQKALLSQSENLRCLSFRLLAVAVKDQPYFPSLKNLLEKSISGVVIIDSSAPVQHALLMLIEVVIKHDVGLAWVVEASCWKIVWEIAVLSGRSKSNMFLSRKTKEVLTSLLWKLTSHHVEVVCSILEKLVQAVSNGEMDKSMSLEILMTLLGESCPPLIKNSLCDTLKRYGLVDAANQCLQDPILAQKAAWIALWLSEPNSEQETYLRVILKLLSHWHIPAILLQFLSHSQQYWKKATVTNHDQAALFATRLLVSFIFCCANENDELNQLLQQQCDENGEYGTVAKMVARTMRNDGGKVGDVSLAVSCIKYNMQFMCQEQRRLALVGLKCLLTHLIQQPRGHQQVLLATIDAIRTIIKSDASLFSPQVFNLHMDMLEACHGYDSRVIVSLLKIMKHSHPPTNLFLCLQKLLDHSDWAVRDSVLELFGHLIAKNEPKTMDPVLQDMCENVFSLCTEDEEAFVRASAFDCLRVMVSVKGLWVVVLPLQVQQCSAKAIDTDTEGIVRKAAVTLLNHMYSYGIITAPCEVMAKAARNDLHWEVKLEAVTFWEKMVHRWPGDNKELVPQVLLETCKDCDQSVREEAQRVTRLLLQKQGSALDGQMTVKLTNAATAEVHRRDEMNSLLEDILSSYSDTSLQPSIDCF